MTREEAINIMKVIVHMIEEKYDTDRVEDAVDMAIEALEQELCEDCISREDALDCLTATGLKKFDFILDARDKIKNLPPVTSQPKIGYWINVNNGNRNTSYTVDGMTNASVKCSECDEWLTASDEYACNGNYCPNCGAKMQEVTE